MIKDKFFVGLTNADGTMIEPLFENEMYAFHESVEIAVKHSIEHKTKIT